MHVLKENQIFIMTGGVIRESPPKFATVKNDYCIVFDRFTEIK